MTLPFRTSALAIAAYFAAAGLTLHLLTNGGYGSAAA